MKLSSCNVLKSRSSTSPPLANDFTERERKMGDESEYILHYGFLAWPLSQDWCCTVCMEVIASQSPVKPTDEAVNLGERAPVMTPVASLGPFGRDLIVNFTTSSSATTRMTALVEPAESLFLHLVLSID